MTSCAYARLVVRVWLELLSFDVMHAVCGFRRTLHLLPEAPPSGVTDTGLERRVHDAVLLAAALYFKPVLCLQRSFCAARVLRAHGVAARLVIGYRPVPFFSHAWLEVDGRVVNDSPVYRQRLQVLYSR